jgi:hypothetical protein
MKYILLAYTNAAQWTSGEYDQAEFEAACRFYEDLGKELTESGEGGRQRWPGRPVVHRDAAPAGLGGGDQRRPYAETKEVLVSFGIVDVDSHERALEIAGRVVAAIGDTVDVRPLPDGVGGEVGGVVG